MAGNEFLDKNGLATLWERIRRLVYECRGDDVITYRLESEGSYIVLIGSDGSRSLVAVPATVSCDEE